jgi:hypothetical protein
MSSGRAKAPRFIALRRKSCHGLDVDDALHA